MKVNQSMSSLQELFQLIYLKEIYEHKSGSNVLLFLSKEIGFNDDVLVYGLLRCIRKFYMGSSEPIWALDGFSVFEPGGSTARSLASLAVSKPRGNTLWICLFHAAPQIRTCNARPLGSPFLSDKVI